MNCETVSELKKNIKVILIILFRRLSHILLINTILVVSLYVLHESSLRHKPFPTNLATEVLVPCVFRHVDLEVVRLFELFATHVA